MTDQPITYVAAQEFQEDGYLQEINREWLHPLGMALAVQTYEPAERRAQLREKLAATLRDAAGKGALTDLADALLAALADDLDLDATAVFAGIIDARDDPEGYIFAMPETLPDGRDTLAIARARAQTIADRRMTYAMERNDRFGWEIQPVDTMVRSTTSDEP